MDWYDMGDLQAQPSIIAPKYTHINYIGIEIECIFPDSGVHNFLEHLYLTGLDGKLIIDDDGSIDTNDDTAFSCELKLLTDEKSYKDDLKKLAACLRVAQVEVNQTCGLHVHLDAYNIPAKNLIQKLNKFKTLFQEIVPKHRRNNSYCAFNSNYSTHYNWINITSHGTVEIRCHEGTINMKDVERFISLLLSIKYSKDINKIKGSLKQLALSKSDKKYFEKRMKQLSNKEGDKYYV